MRGLQAEELLNLVPDQDGEGDAGGDHDGQDEPEAQAGQAPLPSPVFAYAAFDPLPAVVPLDRRRVEQLLLDVLSFGQGHAGSLKSLRLGRRGRKPAPYLKEGELWP
jgi:hypothetical protein